MYQKGVFLISGLLVISLFACSSARKDDTQSQTPPPAVQQPAAPPPPAQAQPAEPAPKPEPPPAPEVEKPVPHRPASQRPNAPAPAPAKAMPGVNTPPQPAPAGAAPITPKPASETPVPPPPKPIVILSGTRFEVRLIDPISSADNKSGDTFQATLDQNLEADGKIVVPKGSTVVGKLIDVRQSGRVEGLAAMSITLTKIIVGEASYPIQTNTLAFQAEKTTKQDATKIGIGAGIGAIIGAIAGGGKGAAIGAAVGGGAGTATVLVTKGKEVKFQPEERFSFVLRSDLGIRQ